MRQNIAMAIVFFTMKYIYEGKLRKFLIGIIVAALFHYSSLLFIPAYFIWNKPQKIKIKLGGKMIFDGIKEVKDKECECCKNGIKDNLKLSEILLQSVATSIDALAVGISLYASINVDNYKGLSIWMIVPCIIVVTFILSLIGGLFGKKIGSFFKKIAPFIGGLVLIIIGISILVEHIG
jgi:putative Mn2+ efflux pump MntP